MSDTWSVPADVVAWLCEVTGMPWPLVWPPLTVPSAVQRAPVDVSDPDAALLIDRRLAALMGVEGVGAHLLREPSRQVRGGPREMRWFVGTHADFCDLPGIPDGVTDPAEARAWAMCWLYPRCVHRCMCAELAKVQDVPGGLTWGDIAACTAFADLPLLLPLRNGEPCEVPHGA